MQTRWLLCGLCLLLCLGILLLEYTAAPVPKAHYDAMLEATRRTRAAFEAIKAERLRLGSTVDLADDPNATGMIGASYTEITTTLGALDAKRSTANPNVAAMLVDMLVSLDIGAGDVVLVNLSGSFPCLNIALLCALDTLGAQGRVIFSVGASTYGANDPDFTYGDMESFLYESGLIGQKSIGFSMGGKDDLGLEMPKGVREAIAARLQGYGYAYYACADFAANMAARVAAYGDGEAACFVNVGGNLLSFGVSSTMHTVPGGVLYRDTVAVQGDGLVQHYLGAGMPVIHLLNMKGLLPAYGLPIDPVPLPKDGEGGVYWETGYQMWLVWGLLVVAVVGVGMVGWGRRRHVGPA